MGLLLFDSLKLNVSDARKELKENEMLIFLVKNKGQKVVSLKPKTMLVINFCFQGCFKTKYLNVNGHYLKLSLFIKIIKIDLKGIHFSLLSI